MLTSPKLILASSSPRRKELLASVGVNCNIQPADVDECRLPQESVERYIKRVAMAKGLAVAATLNDEKTAILSADTIVVQGQEIFGKPRNKEDAFQVWQKLSDNTHQVMTAVCLLVGKDQQIVIVATDVSFKPISEAQMQRYWQSGEPLDKAGAYAIQGLASAWVKFIRGSYSNVVGLPMCEVNSMLTKVGLNWL